MKPPILHRGLLLLVLMLAIPAQADIYVWVDEEGTRHLTNRTPPNHANIVLTFEELPFDPQADLERREQERREQEEMERREIAEREAALAQQQSMIDAAYLQAEAALRQAEAVLAERQQEATQYRGRTWRPVYYTGRCYGSCAKQRYHRFRGKDSRKKRSTHVRHYRHKRHRSAKHRDGKHLSRGPHRRKPAHGYGKSTSQGHGNSHLSVSRDTQRRSMRGRYRAHGRPRVEARAGRSHRSAGSLRASRGGHRHSDARIGRSTRVGGRAGHTGTIGMRMRAGRP